MTASQKHKIVDLRRRRPGLSRPPQRELPFSSRAQGRRRFSLRTRRRRAHAWLAFFIAAALAVSVLSLHYVSWLPRFTVQKISIVGAHDVPTQDIENFADALIHAKRSSFFAPSNIFLYDPRHVATALRSHFPRIESVDVGRATMFSTTIIIKIAERQPYALWCAPAAGSVQASSTPLLVPVASDCYELDKTGFVFASASNTTSASAYTFEGGLASATGSSAIIGSTFAPGHFQGVLSFLHYLEQGGFAPTGASVAGATDFTVPLRSGYYLKASLGEDAEQLVKNLQLVLSSDTLAKNIDRLEYVDLRFGDRVYYKFKASGARQ